MINFQENTEKVDFDYILDCCRLLSIFSPFKLNVLICLLVLLL